MTLQSNCLDAEDLRQIKVFLTVVPQNILAFAWWVLPNENERILKI